MLATTILGFTLGFIWYMLLLFIWVVIALIPASIAHRKGHSFIGWFLLSIFFWWITLFVAIFMKDRTVSNSAQSQDSVE